MTCSCWKADRYRSTSAISTKDMKVQIHTLGKGAQVVYELLVAEQSMALILWQSDCQLEE